MKYSIKESTTVKPLTINDAFSSFSVEILFQKNIFFNSKQKT